MSMPIALNKDLLSSASTGVREDIHSFLEKPVIVQSGTFTTNDTSGSFAVKPVFQALLSSPIYQNKVSGFLGVKATVVLRLQVNAQKFQQGKYLLCFAPFCSPQYLAGDAKLKMLRTDKTTVSQLPHVEVDLACDTEAILELPYVSPFSHYLITSSRGQGEIGSFFVYPYAPLRTGAGGPQSCEFTLWASMKDIELVAPTIPQGLFEFQMAGPKPSRGRKGIPNSEVEANSQMVGPISGVMSRVSKAADVVAQIPMLTAIAKPVSWAMSIASGVASAFGWSKPINLEHVMKMQHHRFPYSTNPNAVDNSVPLHFFSDNTLEALPGFAGSNVDETSIDFIKTVPAYYQQFEWNTTQDTGTVLFSTHLDPSLFMNTYTSAANVTYSTMTPVTCLSKMFTYYRGSLRFTFKVVKTEFHSGRLIFAYAPGTFVQANDNIPIINITNSSYCHREILDVRSGNEFSFVVPYSSLSPYKRTRMDPYGAVSLMVLNELVAPETVNQSLTIICEVSAAPDFEVAVPNGATIQPVVPFTIQGNFEFQMDMGSKRNDCSISDNIVGGSSIFNDHLSSARFCIGEKISSLMSLVKRKQFRDIYQSNFPVTGGKVVVAPFAVSTGAHDPSSGNYTQDNVSCDRYSLLAHMYALSRGGVRMGFNFVTFRSDPSLEGYVSLIESRQFLPTTLNDIDSGSDTTGWLPESSNRIPISSDVEVQVAHYNTKAVRVNAEYMVCGNALVSYDSGLFAQTGSDIRLYLDLASSTLSTSNTKCARGVADDFQFGYFTGIPPCYMSVPASSYPH